MNRIKIITPPRNKPKKITTTSIIPAVDSLQHDAKCIIAAELAHYRQKVSRGATLDLKEARIVQGYLDTLIKLSKDEREASRSEDLSNLSNEELLALALEIAKTTKPALAKPSESGE